MTVDYYRVVGDTDSPIEDTLTADGSDVDISGYQSVEFHLEKPDGSTISDDDTGDVTVDDAAAGDVSFAFSAGDLDQRGEYRYEWQVTFSDGGIETFPGEDMGIIRVRPELA